eukprot:1140753-Pelagomonas_calceolata.AAC.3
MAGHRMSLLAAVGRIGLLCFLHDSHATQARLGPPVHARVVLPHRCAAGCKMTQLMCVHELSIGRQRLGPPVHARAACPPC